MKNKLTILGSGSSLGSPWITNYWGNIKKKSGRNIRTRCSCHIQYKGLSILIDTSPDIKAQFKQNKIKSLDAIMYSHDHADQTAGIFELRPFYWMNKKKIPIFASLKTIKDLKLRYSYCFRSEAGYKPILKANIIKNKFIIKAKKKLLKVNSFEVNHGYINTTAFIFEKIAYISDCKRIYSKTLNKLKNLNLLIIDCLRIKKHPSHLNYSECIKLIESIKPKKAILTNLHVDFQYDKLKKKLPKNIEPAYDGLSINF